LCSSILNLDAQLVWRWYLDQLSGFRQAEADGNHYLYDLHSSTKGDVRVPVFKKENFGKEMAINDDILRHLVVARLCQPTSKAGTVDYLKFYFDKDVELHKIYRYLDRLYNSLQGDQRYA
jgi:hypothetical protein